LLAGHGRKYHLDAAALVAPRLALELGQVDVADPDGAATKI
jgi:hypothetical protein